MPEPPSNWWSRSSGVLGRSTRGASQMGLPSSNCRSSAQATPLPETRKPKKSCFASGWTGKVMEYSLHGVVPFNWRFCILSKARSGDSPSSRIHKPTKSLTSSVRTKPRNSMLVPEKSIGIDFVIVEKTLGLSAWRSIRADQRPPCTVLSSAKIVPGGPPRHPPGMLPDGGVSKLSAPWRSEWLGSWLDLASCA